MKIKSFQGGFDKNLSYLIWCESTHIAGIVDASVNAHLFNFDVSDDISLNIRPYSTLSNTGVSFTLNF